MRSPVATHIVTGFLGVGKTTAILHLLQHKPAEEKWAVLVNEFGEIGIDGAILEGRGATIKEIPGGCLCCVNGLPLQVGLNQLLAQAQPDRLLIEPTGLGHPQNVLDVLTGPYYRDVLELRAVLCLVDPCKLEEPRYREHETLRAQLQIADVIVANKTDLCSAAQRQGLEDFLGGLRPPRRVDAWVERGAVDAAVLQEPHAARTVAHAHGHAHAEVAVSLPVQLGPGESWLRRESRGLEHASCGWLFTREQPFDFGRLFGFCSGLMADRLKAVVNTERGAFIFNAENGVLSVLDAAMEGDSRIEIIHREALDWDALERELRSALMAGAA
jgi:G3E family GTPase